MENKMKELETLLHKNFEGENKYDIEKVLIYSAMGIIGSIFLYLIVVMVLSLLQ